MIHVRIQDGYGGDQIVMVESGMSQQISMTTSVVDHVTGKHEFRQTMFTITLLEARDACTKEEEDIFRAAYKNKLLMEGL